MTMTHVGHRVIRGRAAVQRHAREARGPHGATWPASGSELDGEAAPFEPGQYMTIGVFADGKLYQRPYSVASAAGDAGTEGYEFYVRHVPVLRFTTLLWRLPGRGTGCA